MAKLFSGVRFFLPQESLDLVEEGKLVDTLLKHGAVRESEYQECSHVIVCNLLFDDPICAAARKDRKALVLKDWVNDSVEVETRTDPNSALYIPVRDLKGIPECRNFCISLTLYTGRVRNEIMRMVKMMGAKFFKNLNLQEATHLVCYKFEGNKYEAARQNGIKLVNHRWLEDCLKSWSLLDENDYAISGFEVEEAEQKLAQEIQENIVVVTASVPQTIEKPPASNKKAQPAGVEDYDIGKFLGRGVGTENAGVEEEVGTGTKSSPICGTGSLGKPVERSSPKKSPMSQNKPEKRGHDSVEPKSPASKKNKAEKQTTQVQVAKKTRQNEAQSPGSRKRKSPQVRPVEDRPPETTPNEKTGTTPNKSAQTGIPHDEAEAGASSRRQSKEPRNKITEVIDLDSLDEAQGPEKRQKVQNGEKKRGRKKKDTSSSSEKQYRFSTSGHDNEKSRLHRIIRSLKGKICRDFHNWNEQTTHYVVMEPLRRTEKFFAAAAAGRWILKSQYLEASENAGHFVDEEEYEWHGTGMNSQNTLELGAFRHWRKLKEESGYGAFQGLRAIIYGKPSLPPEKTLRRAIVAGGGTVVACSPPYSSCLARGVDYAICGFGVNVNEQDRWIREFRKHGVACVSEEYFVDFVFKPNSSLQQHVLFGTSEAERISRQRLADIKAESRCRGQEVDAEDDYPCSVCKRPDNDGLMLLCDGCDVATHTFCCKPPLDGVPDAEWYCDKCVAALSHC